MTLIQLVFICFVLFLSTLLCLPLWVLFRVPRFAVLPFRAKVESYRHMLVNWSLRHHLYVMRMARGSLVFWVLAFFLAPAAPVAIWLRADGERDVKMDVVSITHAVRADRRVDSEEVRSGVAGSPARPVRQPLPATRNEPPPVRPRSRDMPTTEKFAKGIKEVADAVREGREKSAMFAGALALDREPSPAPPGRRTRAGAAAASHSRPGKMRRSDSRVAARAAPTTPNPPRRIRAVAASPWPSRLAAARTYVRAAGRLVYQRAAEAVFQAAVALRRAPFFSRGPAPVERAVRPVKG